MFYMLLCVCVCVCVCCIFFSTFHGEQSLSFWKTLLGALIKRLVDRWLGCAASRTRPRFVRGEVDDEQRSDCRSELGGCTRRVPRSNEWVSDGRRTIAVTWLASSERRHDGRPFVRSSSSFRMRRTTVGRLHWHGPASSRAAAPAFTRTDSRSRSWSRSCLAHSLYICAISVVVTVPCRYWPPPPSLPCTGRGLGSQPETPRGSAKDAPTEQRTCSSQRNRTVATDNKTDGFQPHSQRHKTSNLAQMKIFIHHNNGSINKTETQTNIT